MIIKVFKLAVDIIGGLTKIKTCKVCKCMSLKCPRMMVNLNIHTLCLSGKHVSNLLLKQRPASENRLGLKLDMIIYHESSKNYTHFIH